MPRLAAYGLAILAFLAGFVLAAMLSVASGLTVTAEPTPTPTIGPCSAEWERAYEIMRFANESHIPWLERALQDGNVYSGSYATADIDPVATERWWIDHYAEVLATIEMVCVPSPAYPNLTELPGVWESYPPRESAAGSVASSEPSP